MIICSYTSILEKRLKWVIDDIRGLKGIERNTSNFYPHQKQNSIYSLDYSHEAYDCRSDKFSSQMIFLDNKDKIQYYDRV